MKIPWETFKEHIRKGSVFRDSDFKFIDGASKPKWFVILYDEIIGDSYIICITTSQTETYKNSYATYLKVNDDAFGKECIIEIDRTDFYKADILKEKYVNNQIEFKGVIKSEVYDVILEKIEQSKSIPTVIRDILLHDIILD